MGTGMAIRVKKAGLGDENGLGVENSWLEEVSQVSIIVRIGPDGETMHGKL